MLLSANICGYLLDVSTELEAEIKESYDMLPFRLSVVHVVLVGEAYRKVQGNEPSPRLRGARSAGRAQTWPWGAWHWADSIW